jgi:DHA2 family multidrug resistance protein
MPASRPAAAAPRLSGGALTAAVTICVMLATIMQALDTTIANVALPYMQGSLAASQDQINWVLTSYIVAAAIMTPPTGWLAGRFGRKRLFLVSVAGFTVASALCGLAASLPQMVAFRLLQGVFGASLVPLSQAVLLDLYPREKQGSAMALWGVGVMVGPILGPTLGGWLTENYDWRWVFFINLPIGLLTFLGIVAFLAETPRRRDARLDWFGFAALSLGIGALQMMLDRGQQLDWFSAPEVLVETGLAALGFYLFLVQMLTGKRPFVSPQLFRDRNFATGLVFIFVIGIILLATLALLTPFLQGLMGYPVITAGLALAPRGAGTMLAMLVVGRLIGRVDARLLILLGLGVTAFALWEMTGFTADVSQGTIMRTGFVQGMGLGFIFVPLSTVTFATLPPALRTEATGLFSLVRNIGSSIGISIVGSLLVSNTQVVHSELVQHVTPWNAVLQQPWPSAMYNMATAAGRGALDAVIGREAAIIAYLDDFKLMMLIALLAMPLVLLLRRPRGAGGGHAAAALD